MGRRYRRRNNSITSIVSDVVYIAAKLPWWGALLTGMFSYIAIYLMLGGYIESQLAAQEGSKLYPIIEVRLIRIVRVCEWVGIACFLVGVFFSIRNFFVSKQARYTEKSIVTIVSKILGRNLD